MRRAALLLAALAACLAPAAGAAGARAHAAAGAGRIAFMRVDAAGLDIWAVDPDGAHLRRLTTSHRAAEPAFSPDGSRIAYVDEGGIWVMGRNGTGKRFVAALADPAVESRPAWSPDGKQLAFASYDTLYVAPSSGGSARRIAAGTNPAWSPDGRRIAFIDTQKGIPARIWVAAVDGSGARAITPRGPMPSHLAWGPDGRIAFTFDPNGTPRLGIVAADGSGRRTAGQGIRDVAWSPDGTQLVVEAAADHTIAVIGSDGAVRPIGSGSAPAWGR